MEDGLSLDDAARLAVPVASVVEADTHDKPLKLAPKTG
jgi:hypothetical protein